MKKLKDDVFEFLKKHYLCSLATVDSAHKPHVSVVYYTFDEELNLYCVTRKAMEKYKNILENPNVAIMMFEEESRSTLQISGVAEIISLQPENEPVVNKLLENGHLGNMSSFVPLASLEKGSPVILIKIAMKHLKWTYETGSDTMVTETIDLSV